MDIDCMLIAGVSMGRDFSFNESQTLLTMIDGLYARPGLRA
jgi:hypothetical protein